MLSHLVHPLVLYAKKPVAAPVRLQALSPDEIRGITPLLRQRLFDAVASTHVLGFGSTLYAANTGAVNFDSVVALLERDDRHAIAFVHAAEGTHTPMQVSFVISSRFADGRVIVTGNSGVVLRTPSRRHVDGLTVAGCGDLGRLWAMHSHRLRQHERQSAGVPTTRGGDPIGYQFDEACEVQQHWVDSGYYVRLAGGALDITAKGAALSAWRGLWPWKQRTQARHAQRVARMSREMTT